MTVLTLLRRWRVRCRARADYRAAERAAGRVQARLAQAYLPGERADLLTALADHEYLMAYTHRAAFGPDPMAHEDGRDLAESLKFSAELAGLLAEVERCVADGRPFGRCGTFPLIAAAGPVMAIMAITADLAGRTALLAELYDAVEPVIGGQAAELLWCLRSPGHSGWLTVAAKDRWAAEPGSGRLR